MVVGVLRVGEEAGASPMKRTWGLWGLDGNQR